MAALRDVKKQGQCVITTDVHEIAELGEFESAQPWVDVIQIPAFLSRQTDLLMEAAITAVRTDAIVNIKKGQFMTHKDAQAAIDKVRHHGAACWITERGNCFGYSDVVIDPCNFVPYANAHLIADCTHTNRGNIENTIMLARAALACGVDGLFMETTIMPSRAYCDGDKMIPLHRLEETIKQIREGLENV